MQQDGLLVVGTGNLAWHLTTVLRRAGQRVASLSRSGPVGEWPVPVMGYDRLPSLTPTGVFLAVPDDRIAEVSRELADALPTNTPVFHTSGATPVERIDGRFPHRGVLWPVRSLHRGGEVAGWHDLPLVFQATTAAARGWIAGLAGKLSDTTHELDNEQRAQLHLAAVFSNNFVTWLYQIAFELCAERGVPFALLLPIIRETARQQDGRSPALRQTGAAARGDSATLERHLTLLRKPAYRELYGEMSALIAAGARSDE